MPQDIYMYICIHTQENKSVYLYVRHKFGAKERKQRKKILIGLEIVAQ
jgi:hypothetical protein